MSFAIHRHHGEVDMAIVVVGYIPDGTKDMDKAIFERFRDDKLMPAFQELGDPAVGGPAVEISAVDTLLL
jgi:hypothetical protein